MKDTHAYIASCPNCRQTLPAVNMSKEYQEGDSSLWVNFRPCTNCGLEVHILRSGYNYLGWINKEDTVTFQDPNIEKK